jgi:hypothetical protein
MTFDSSLIDTSDENFLKAKLDSLEKIIENFNEYD